MKFEVSKMTVKGKDFYNVQVIKTGAIHYVYRDLAKARAKCNNLNSVC